MPQVGRSLPSLEASTGIKSGWPPPPGGHALPYSPLLSSEASGSRNLERTQQELRPDQTSLEACSPPSTDSSETCNVRTDWYVSRRQPSLDFVLSCSVLLDIHESNTSGVYPSTNISTMLSPLCYLCGGSLSIKRAASSTRLPTKRLRHGDCYKSMPSQARTSVVQEMLQACAEPSYSGADDEMDVRTAEIWTVAFLRFLGPQQLTGLASLPPELRIRVGNLLPSDSFARAVTLEYTSAKATSILRRPGPPPTRNESLQLQIGTTMRIRRRHFDGRSYIVGLDEQVQTSSELGNPDFLTLASDRDWTYLVLALDVTGCRTLSLHSPTTTACTSPSGVWYRVVPRSALASPKRFVCSYRGRTLRDMIDSDNQQIPLFDSVPSFLRLRWFAESPGRKWTASGPPRMMRRRAGPDVTAITVAFLGGATVDVHFHRGSISGTEAFYRSLDRFGPAVVLRYAELRPMERLVNVGVRICRAKLGGSSACLLFLTSEGRLVDLAPYVSGRMRADYDLHGLLEQSGQVEAVYLNKRLDNSMSAAIAVQTEDSQGQGQRPATHHWLLNTSAPEDEPPVQLQTHCISVFRDVIDLEGIVDVWEDMDQHGNRLCKGIRAPGRILGLWKGTTRALEETETLTLQQNLQGCSLVNIQQEGRWEVCIARETDKVLDGERYLLREGCRIVWWSGKNGNVVQVY